MGILEQKAITSQDDLVRLNIIDWNRLNGTSNDPAEAMRAISSWFIDRSIYTIVEHDLRHAPQRNDFPSWDHVGNSHGRLARLFWNDFYYHHPESKLHFADEPDFSGTFKCKDGSFARLWGDIGQVSASAFALTTIRQMQKHDAWISVLSDNQQIMIEVLDDIQALFQETMGF